MTMATIRQNLIRNLRSELEKCSKLIKRGRKLEFHPTNLPHFPSIEV
jgi:hypothetical protein